MNKKLWLIVIFFIFTVGVVSSTKVYITPNDQLITKGNAFNITVFCESSENIRGYEFKIEFDKSKIRFDSYFEGDIFEGFPTFFSPTFRIDNDNGTVNDVYSLIVGKGNATENGSLLTLFGTALNVTNGIPFVKLIDTGVCNESRYLNIDVQNGKVEVRGLNRFDVNGDETVNVIDVNTVWVRRGDYSLLDDVNSDGVVNVLDVTFVWLNRG